MQTNIGVAISTRNRREMAEHSIQKWRDFLPASAKLVIVDDASDVPYPGADYRFETQAGIAVVKNKCLELLEGCEHLFLVDDDIYPLDAWAPYYVNSNLQHACYIFDRKMLWKEPDYVAYDLPRGCLMYFTKRCIEKAGGFNTNFKIYGYDHAELSRRIFNMKLTPAAYIDIPDSKGLFYCHDEQLTVRSSLPLQERTRFIRGNKKLFDDTFSSNTFIPYK